MMDQNLGGPLVGGGPKTFEEMYPGIVSMFNFQSMLSANDDLNKGSI
jgi:hypothetical protein